MRRRSAEICVHVPNTVALYILNQKRDSLVQLEARYAIRVLIAQDDALIPPAFRLERLRAFGPVEPAPLAAAPLTQVAIPDEEEEEFEETAETSEAEQEGADGQSRTRRRRRRRRRHEDEPAAKSTEVPAGEEPGDDEAELVGENGHSGAEEASDDEESEAERRRRRRGRRGGRRRGRREVGGESGFEGPRPAADTVEILPTPEMVESEPMLEEARASWPAETGALAIETASLPALAGDQSIAVQTVITIGEGEPERDAPIVAMDHRPVHPHPAGEAPEAEGKEQPGSRPTAEAEQGVPYASETERELEPAAAESEPQREPESAVPVETVIDKPANPRRGWWQRLIQS